MSAAHWFNSWEVLSRKLSSRMASSHLSISILQIHITLIHEARSPRCCSMPCKSTVIFPAIRVYGDRLRPPPGLRTYAEFQFPLLFDERGGFLAALAYQSFHMVARLPLHFAGRKPGIESICLPQLARHDDFGRFVAREQVDVSHLGCAPRSCPDCASKLGADHCALEIDPRESDCIHGLCGRNLLLRLHLLDLLPLGGSCKTDEFRRLESCDVHPEAVCWMGRSREYVMFDLSIPDCLSCSPVLRWCIALNFRRVFATWWRRLPAPLFALGYGCLSELILLFMPVKYAPFIYFQF